MSKRTIAPIRRSRSDHLATCLAVALGLATSTAYSNERPGAQPLLGPSTVFDRTSDARALSAKSTLPYAAMSRLPDKPSAQSRHVTDCGDDAQTPGTLRYEIAQAASGDVIDLANLMCSTITLGSEILVPQDTLYLQGPASGSLTIDAYFHSRVFDHTGLGALSINNLTIANGYYSANNTVEGGCIRSMGDVYLQSSIVEHCTVHGPGLAYGGGIYALGNLTLFGSTISGGSAEGMQASDGGDAFVRGHFGALYSTITYGSAYSGTMNGLSNGGGVFVTGGGTIQSSTVSNNHGEHIGALAFVGASGSVSIVNSTVSTNTSVSHVAGIYTDLPLTLANSTVAFNTSRYYVAGIGLTAKGANVTITSSIIADNVGSYGMNDFAISGGIPSFSASIVTSGSPFVGVNQACPKLGPLGDNGGPTLTHQLLHSSPAIDQGEPGSLVLDQRQAPRVAGSQADIGSVEWQPGELDERVFVGGFDTACER